MGTTAIKLKSELGKYIGKWVKYIGSGGSINVNKVWRSDWGGLYFTGDTRDGHPETNGGVGEGGWCINDNDFELPIENTAVEELDLDKYEQEAINEDSVNDIIMVIYKTIREMRKEYKALSERKDK